MLVALRSFCQPYTTLPFAIEAAAYIVEHQKDLALLSRRCGQRPDPTQARRLRERCSALAEDWRCPLREQRARWAGETEGGACEYHCERVERVTQGALSW